MEERWSQLSNQEKDLIIARDILMFNCINEDGKGMDWYNSQYSLGHWRYSTNLEDALDLFDRIIEKRIFSITMGKSGFQCNLILEEGRSQVVNISSHSLPNLICLISLYLKEANM